LAALVRAVAGGRGGEVWVEGEPGVGKSALLAAGLAGAEGLGCRVFWATADELGQRFPLRVMRDCLQVVPGSSDPDRREILDLLRGGGTAGAASPDPVPACVERLLVLVNRLCAGAAVLLVVDDLHWADEASLVVWQQLSRAVRQLPLLLVGACRPVPRRAELAALRRDATAAGATVVGLDGLPAEPVVELVGGLLGARVVGPRLRAVVGQAAGNPLYVREMVDALERERRLRVEGGRVELVEADAGVPVSLAAAISARLGFVSTPTLGVLRLAALLGAQFSVDDLGVVAGRPAPELSVVVEEGMAAGLLVESGVRLAFRHALIRRVLYEGTPAALRVALHGHSAKALAEAGAAVERVAGQLLAAFADTDAAQAIEDWAIEDWVLDWLTGPGRALAYRSPKVAADLLDRAVAHAGPEDPRREQLQTILASVLVLLGRREEAIALAERVRAATRDSALAAEVSYLLARALSSLARHEQAIAVLDDALRDPDGGVWTVRLRALRSLVAIQGGDDRETAAREALAEAEGVGDQFAISIASNALFLSLVGHGDLNAGLAVLERALAMLGDEPHTADRQLVLLDNRIAVLTNLDRLAEAGAAVRELVAAAERYASPHRLATSRCRAALVFYETGRWDEALAELETAAESSAVIPAQYQLLLHGLRALLAAHRDDAAIADAHLAAVDQPVRTAMVAHASQSLVMARAVLAERRGHPGQALAVLADLLRPDYPEELSERRWLPDLTRLAVAVGDTATAQSAVAAAAADAGAEATPSRTAVAGHCRGLLDGDPAPLLAAAETYRAVGRPFELGRALEDAAVLLAGRGDVPAARAAYAEAVEQYAGLRADWDLLRADNRLRQYGIRRGRGRRRRPATGWEALTPTELKVARLVADGQSNPDIAAGLFLSRRTVEVHVSHILTKLDARSRVEIAREATAYRPATGRPSARQDAFGG